MNDDPRAIYRKMATLVLGEAPADANEVVVEAVQLARIGEALTSYAKPDGSRDMLEIESFELEHLIVELREAMYREGSGTWFSMRLRFGRDGSFSADFDYDNEPTWEHPIDPASYAEDLERYPRNPDHTPDWLRARLVEAAAGTFGPGQAN